MAVLFDAGVWRAGNWEGLPPTCLGSEVPRSLTEFRGCGMWVSARAVVSGCKKARIVASGDFPMIGLHLVVPLRARRVGSYKAELVAESRRLARVSFRGGAVAEEALSSITVCGSGIPTQVPIS